MSETNSTPSAHLSPYQRIEISLRARIDEGHWAEGAALPGRRKLAQEYGVALSTMQRAISKLLEDGTLLTDGHLGTFVASPGAENKTHAVGRAIQPRLDDSSEPRSPGLRIGVLLTDSTPIVTADGSERNSFFHPLFDGIRSVLAEENIAVSYLYRHRRSYSEVYRNSKCDALIILAPISQELTELQILAEEDFPYVALLCSPSSVAAADLPCIDSDNRDGTAQAIRHLLELGHEKIAIVNLAISNADMYDRLSAYFQTMARAHLPVAPEHILIDSYPWCAETFEQRIEHWLTGLKDDGRLPSAIFACDFTMTLKTLAVLQRLRLRIPEDISLVGFDDDPLAEHFSPPLTLVRQPVFQLGRRAAVKLLDHLKTSSGRLYGCEKMPTQLIVRGSTGTPHSVNETAPVQRA